MAETVKIKIETQGADKLTDNLQEAVEVGKSLKAQYKEAVLEVQRLAAAYGETSVEVREAAKRAAALKDTIEDTNDTIAAFKGEGAFLAMGRAVGAVASGFAAVQGGLGLIGVESEDVEKTILKVQSAMALAQGLAGLEDAGRAFKTLGAAAQNALSGIRSGIAATGIGVLLIALGAVVAYWDEISAALGIVSEEQKKLNEAQIAQKKIADEQTASVKKESQEFVGLVSMLKATNAGSKERKNLISNINAQYGTTLKNIKDETTFQNQLNQAVKDYILQKQNEFTLKANEGVLIEQFEKKAAATKEFNKQLKSLTAGFTLIDKEQGLYLSNTAKSATVLDRNTGKYVSAAVTLGDLRDKNSAVNTVMLKQEEIMRETDGVIENLSKTNLKLAGSSKIVNTDLNETVIKTGEAKEAITDYTKEINDAQINLISDESQRQQTKLISDAAFRKEDIEKSNASAQQKADFTKAIDAQLLIDLDKSDKEFSDKKLAREKQLVTDMVAEDEKFLNKMTTARDLETSFMEEGISKEIQMRENSYQNQLVLLQKYLDDETITREQYDAFTVAAEIKKAADVKAITDKSAQEELNTTIQINQAKIAVIAGTSEFLRAIGTQNKGILLAALALEKGVAIANVVISAQAEIAGHAANAAANPTNAFTFGGAGISQLAALTALTKIRAALSIGTILATGINSGRSIVSGGGGGAPPAPPTPPTPPGPLQGTNPNLTAPTPSSLTISGDAMGGSEGGGLQLFGARQGGGEKRSYVVESDISNTQKKLMTYQQRAEIG